MAVCIKEKHGGKITRVSKAKAKALVATGRYAYAPKSDWQRQEGKGKYDTEVSDPEKE